MKTCTKCSEAKSVCDFHKCSSRKDGLRSHCKACVVDANKKWRLNNPDYEATRYQNCKDTHRKRSDDWRLANPEKAKFNRNAWRHNNPSKANNWNSRRRAAKLNSMPSWLTAIHKAQIQEFYDIAAARSVQTGIAHQVDHIHPLQGVGFSGLHVPWNLQVITASENASKCNRL